MVASYLISSFLAYGYHNILRDSGYVLDFCFTRIGGKCLLLFLLLQIRDLDQIDLLSPANCQNRILILQH